MNSIKEKNYCDRCNKTTWHNYFGTTKKRKGFTKCLVCGHKRIL